ncbi:hypothetical protein [Actinomadura sp. HBU206391]|uniref:hypothetical protein n=1 Tax=Actinomadura sp. HBU206391 TaxID=2731692 RepID=UPI0016502D33|nr:hypothetical protein [Actinomadura sp. HBU206391]MBC6457191.1 hypothetical protein [Actinomadura sp. HBU206391]
MESEAGAVCRRSVDRGEGPVSYLAIALLVALVAGVMVTAGIGNAVTGDIVRAVCRVGGDDCGGGPTPGPSAASISPAPSTPPISSSFPPGTDSAASAMEGILAQTPEGRQVLADAKALGIKVVTGTTGQSRYDPTKKEFFLNTNSPLGQNTLGFAIQVGYARHSGAEFDPKRMPQEEWIKAMMDADLRRGELGIAIYEQLRDSGQLKGIDPGVAAMIEQAAKEHERGPEAFRQYLEELNHTSHKKTWCSANTADAKAEAECVNR